MPKKKSEQFFPTDDRVLVVPIYEDEVTAEGIHLPGASKAPSTRGVVVAVGPGKRTSSGIRIKPNVSVGDTVLFGQLSASEVTVNGVTHLVLFEDEITGIITEE